MAGRVGLYFPKSPGTGPEAPGVNLAISHPIVDLAVRGLKSGRGSPAQVLFFQVVKDVQRHAGLCPTERGKAQTTQPSFGESQITPAIAARGRSLTARPEFWLFCEAVRPESPGSEESTGEGVVVSEGGSADLLHNSECRANSGLVKSGAVHAHRHFWAHGFLVLGKWARYPVAGSVEGSGEARTHCQFL